MIGKEKAAKLAKELETTRDKLFNIKDVFANDFKRKTFKRLFKEEIRYKKIDNLTNSWLGFTFKHWKNKIATELIQNILKEVIYDNHNDNYIKPGMIKYSRSNGSHTRAMQYSLWNWNAESVFFIDKEDFELVLTLQLKLINRWYRFTMYENKIEYKQIPPPNYK